MPELIYYNEVDPHAVRWLRNLIDVGLIPHGHVDNRSIIDVSPADLDGYIQCHFFAGIGGWPYALQLADWPEDREVWTGSCPCQPLSCAGQHKGHADERHLWPAFQYLISECKPSTVFGEQVASKDGREWMSGVRADLEAVGYAVGAADLCAASVGSPQIRQRLYWVANSESEGRRWVSMDEAGGVEPRGSGAYLRVESWPDHAGSTSTLSVSDVCVPPYGFPYRVAQLHGLGNAIVPQVAAEFISASLEFKL